MIVSVQWQGAPPSRYFAAPPRRDLVAAVRADEQDVHAVAGLGPVLHVLEGVHPADAGVQAGRPPRARSPPAAEHHAPTASVADPHAPAAVAARRADRRAAGRGGRGGLADGRERGGAGTGDTSAADGRRGEGTQVGSVSTVGPYDLRPTGTDPAGARRCPPFAVT